MVMTIDELRESLGLPPATPGTLIPAQVAAERDAISRPPRVDPERLAEALDLLRDHQAFSGDQLRRMIRRTGDRGEMLRAVLDAVADHPSVEVRAVAKGSRTPGRRFYWRATS